MRAIGMIGLGLLALMMISPPCLGDEKPVPPPAADVISELAAKPAPPVPDGVGLLFFVQTIPCADCQIVKSTILDILDTEFAKEMEQGLIHWRVINFEDEENAALAKHYAIDTTTLVIGRWVKGLARDDHPLPELFDYVDDPPMLEGLFIEELDAALAPKQK